MVFFSFRFLQLFLQDLVENFPEIIVKTSNWVIIVVSLIKMHQSLKLATQRGGHSFPWGVDTLAKRYQ